MNKFPSDRNPQKVKLGREWGSVADHTQCEALHSFLASKTHKHKQNKSPKMHLGTETRRQWRSEGIGAGLLSRHL